MIGPWLDLGGQRVEEEVGNHEPQHHSRHAHPVHRHQVGRFSHRDGQLEVKEGVPVHRRAHTHMPCQVMLHVVNWGGGGGGERDK